MKITKKQLGRLVREVYDFTKLQKGDKVVVSEEGLFKFAKTASHNMRDLEDKLHAALNNGTVGTVIMVAPGQGVRVDFGGYALDVHEWLLERV